MGRYDVTGTSEDILATGGTGDSVIIPLASPLTSAYLLKGEVRVDPDDTVALGAFTFQLVTDPAPDVPAGVAIYWTAALTTAVYAAGGRAVYDVLVTPPGATDPAPLVKGKFIVKSRSVTH